MQSGDNQCSRAYAVTQGVVTVFHLATFNIQPCTESSTGSTHGQVCEISSIIVTFSALP